MGYLLDDLAEVLTTGGISTQIYRGFMPEEPDEAIGLVETGGFPPIRAMSGTPGNAVVEQPTVQIVRRSPSYRRARVEMQVIFRLLDGHGDFTRNGSRYQWIAAQQQPFALGRDESNRELVAMNVLVARSVSTATST